MAARLGLAAAIDAPRRHPRRPAAAPTPTTPSRLQRAVPRPCRRSATRRRLRRPADHGCRAPRPACDAAGPVATRQPRSARRDRRARLATLARSPTAPMARGLRRLPARPRWTAAAQPRCRARSMPGPMPIRRAARRPVWTSPSMPTTLPAPPPRRRWQPGGSRPDARPACPAAADTCQRPLPRPAAQPHRPRSPSASACGASRMERLERLLRCSPVVPGPVGDRRARVLAQPGRRFRRPRQDSPDSSGIGACRRRLRRARPRLPTDARHAGTPAAVPRSGPGIRCLNR